MDLKATAGMERGAAARAPIGAAWRRSRGRGVGEFRGNRRFCADCQRLGLVHELSHPGPRGPRDGRFAARSAMQNRGWTPAQAWP